LENIYTCVGYAIDKIEAEIKHIGYWSSEPLLEVADRFQYAFAMDTMAYIQWLQYAFIPRVREIIAQQGTLHSQCLVGVGAVREFDGDNTAEKLVPLLCKIDELFDCMTRFHQGREKHEKQSDH
jgi:uncharacterized protein YqcC (DUF446 family)